MFMQPCSMYTAVWTVTINMIISCWFVYISFSNDITTEQLQMNYGNHSWMLQYVAKVADSFFFSLDTAVYFG